MNEENDIQATDEMAATQPQTPVTEQLVTEPMSEGAQPETVAEESKPAETPEVLIPPATKKSTDEEAPSFIFLGLSRFEYRQLLEAIVERVNLAREAGEDLPLVNSEWWEYFTAAGQTSVPFADMGLKPLNDSSRGWRQSPLNGRLEYEDSAKVNPIVNGETLSGNRAIRLGRQALSGGAPQNLPLVQSGFSISIKPPLEGDWNLLDETITEQRKAFGWDHYGIGFSNYSVYLLQAVFDWGLQFVTGCSIKAPDGKTSPAELVRQYIDYYDLPVFLAYLAHASYPDGFTYSRPALPSTDSDTASIFNERLSIYHCVVHDWPLLDDWQMDHMTKRAKSSVSVEDVLEYKDRINKIRMSDTIDITDKVKIELTTPSFTEVLQSTDSWLASLKETVMSGLTKSKTDGQRQQSIRNCSRLAQVRAFSAWVKAIHFGDGKGNWGKVVDAKDINDILIDTKNETDVANKIYEAVIRYMERTHISFVCVPTDPTLEYMPPGFDGNRQQRVIPLDILSLVFIQLERVRRKRNT